MECVLDNIKNEMDKFIMLFNDDFVSFKDKIISHANISDELKLQFLNTCLLSSQSNPNSQLKKKCAKLKNNQSFDVGEVLLDLFMFDPPNPMF